jgi:hypothetical protein
MLAKKAHYFINDISLCRKWLYTGDMLVTQSTGENPGPDDCVVCHRAIKKANL